MNVDSKSVIRPFTPDKSGARAIGQSSAIGREMNHVVNESQQILQNPVHLEFKQKKSGVGPTRQTVRIKVPAQGGLVAIARNQIKPREDTQLSSCSQRCYSDECCSRDASARHMVGGLTGVLIGVPVGLCVQKQGWSACLGYGFGAGIFSCLAGCFATWCYQNYCREKDNLPDFD